MGDTVPFRVFGSTAALVTDTAGQLRSCNLAARKLLGIPLTCPLVEPCWKIMRLRTREGRPFCSADCPIRRRLRHGNRELRYRVQHRSSLPVLLDLLTFAMPNTRPQRDQVLHLILPAGDADVVSLASDAARANAANAIARHALECLGTREREILGLLAEGFGTREIAAQLCISAVTVRNHVQHILAKLKVHTRLEAVTLLWRSNSSSLLGQH